MGTGTERKMDGTSHTNGVIDTDILIDATKGREDAIAFLIEQRTAGIQISIISAMELVVGSRDKTELTRIQKFLQGCTVLPVTVNASRVAYQLIESFALSHGLHISDALIGATAHEQNLPLYTKNTRHFHMIPGLAVVRPY